MGDERGRGQSSNQYSLRLDHKLSTNDSLFARFSADNLQGPTTNPSQTAIDPSFGVLYVGDRFEVALSETIHHHALFMVATAQKPGWTSQFREIVLSVQANLHDLRDVEWQDHPALAQDSHSASQARTKRLTR